MSKSGKKIDITKAPYCRFMMAQCSTDPGAVEKMMPVLQAVMEHSAEVDGFEDMVFYRMTDGRVFSITRYRTPEALAEGMKDADPNNPYRDEQLAKIGCKALDAQQMEIIIRKKKNSH